MGIFIDSTQLRSNYIISSDLFDVHEVNRGLRKKNGTGVLVGLNRIGDVHGYEMIDGVKTPVPGKLFYRGIDMSDIIAAASEERRFGFEETIFLLLVGSLPVKEELFDFTKELRSRRTLPKGFDKEISFNMLDGNLMNRLARTVLALYEYDENPDSADLDVVFNQCLDLISRFPVLLAKMINPEKESDESLGVAENFLHMLRPDGKFTDLEARILDSALVLHAEHGGGTNSTFTVHVVASTGSDTYSAVSAAIGSLKGSKHGGANSKVLQMMHETKLNVRDWTDRDEVRSYLAKLIRKEAGDKSGLIYGMGHAVYTVSDPRAVIFMEQAKLLAKEKGRDAEMNLYLAVADLAPEVFADIRKSEKQICANVDFFTGFIYDMLGIPERLCTPIFAMSRIVGWCAHRIDELINSNRIIRPAYKDVSARKIYIPLDNRVRIDFPSSEKEIKSEVKI